MNVELGPEEQRKLEALAAEQGEAPQEIVRRIVASALRSEEVVTESGEATRRSTEGGGIFVLRTGQPVPVELTDEALRQVREERTGGRRPLQ